MKGVFHYVLSLRRLFSHWCIFDLNKQSVSILKNQYFVISLRLYSHSFHHALKSHFLETTGILQMKIVRLSNSKALETSTFKVWSRYILDMCYYMLFRQKIVNLSMKRHS